MNTSSFRGGRRMDTRGRLHVWKKSTAGLLAVLFCLISPLQTLAAEASAPVEATDTVSVSEDSVVQLEAPTSAPVKETEDTLPELGDILNPDNSSEEDSDTKEDFSLFDGDAQKEEGEEGSKLEPGGDTMSLLGGGGPEVEIPELKNGAPFANALNAHPNIDRQNGSMSYTYPLVLPPGRNGLTPELLLTYSSNLDNIDQGLFGNGWNISIPKIERMARQGNYNLYSTNRYQSSVSGDLNYLGSNEYSARIEQGDFIKYKLISNVWTAETKDGMIYTYGATNNERQSDAADTSKIYTWYISKIQDTNGNYITFTYTKDQGVVYPEDITYTNAPTSSGIFKVTFVRGTRDYPALSYRPAFAVTSEAYISHIEIRTQNILRKDYALAYTVGDNGSTPLLRSITETGFDINENGTSLPATVFDYSGHTPAWTTNVDSNKWQYPTLDLANQDGTDIEYVDINGDGLTDIVTSRTRYEEYDWTGSSWSPKTASSTPYEYRTFINTSSTWVEDPTWKLPMPFHTMLAKDTGLRLVDVNGDGLLDVLVFGPEKWTEDTTPGSYPNWKYVFMNNGAGWTYDEHKDIPVILAANASQDNGVRFADVNGDGLTDILTSNGTNGSGTPLSNYAYLNSGTGWGSAITTWNYPAAVHSWFPGSQSNWKITPSIFFIDLNGDGLQDILWEGYYESASSQDMYVTGTYRRAYLNNGAGWTQNDAYAAPVMLTSAWYSSPSGANTAFISHGSALVDVNGDGLTDIMHTQNTSTVDGTTWIASSTQDTIRLNTGHGWISSTTTFPVHFVNMVGVPTGTPMHLYNKHEEGVRVADFNGDGAPDIVEQPDVALIIPGAMHLGTPGPADVMSHFTLPTGAITDISYQPIGAYQNTTGTRLNPLLPVTQMYVVTNLTTYNGADIASQSSYVYEGGRNYYPSTLPIDRAFAGFAKVTETTGDTVKIGYYHQADGSNSSQGEYSDGPEKMGKAYREEVRGTNGLLYSAKITKWDSTTLAKDGSEIREHYNLWSPQSLQMTYNSSGTHLDSAIGNTFDAVGNVVTSTLYGQVTGSDNGTFTDTGSDHRVSKYEYATFGTSTRISGLPFRTTEFANTTTSRITTFIFDGYATGTLQKGNVVRLVETGNTVTSTLVTKWTYDATGVPTLKTDPRGATTTYAYDANKLRVATTTNALGHTNVATWDYAINAPKSIKDANGQIRRAVYDRLGRIKEIYGPDSGGTETLLSQYTYVDTQGSLSVSHTDAVDDVNSVTANTYYDNLGREIQSRRTWPGSTVIAKDTVYDTEGRVSWASLPYVSSGLSKTTSTSNPALKITLEYDPMNRVTTTTDALGTSTNSYDRWSKTTTDRMGRQKMLSYDAFGQLIQVDEQLSGSSVTTAQYTYDWAGNLTKIKDADYAVRNFVYDIFGNRIQADDIHDQSDIYYGIEKYGYDKNGNITTSTRPGGSIVAYRYDPLNRVIETRTPTSTIDQFQYDSCVKGKGKLCKESTASYSRFFDYDALGQVVSSTMRVGTTNYKENKQYAVSGALVRYGTVDGQNVTYGFDGDKIVSVASKEAGVATTTLVSAITYHPSGIASEIMYGNGAHSLNTIDDDELYRVTHKATNVGANTLQDISYSYDTMGNITSLTEAASTTAARSVSYAYDDWDRLVGATGTSAGAGILYAENYTYDTVGNLLSKTFAQASSTITSNYTYADIAYYTWANNHAVIYIENTDGTSTLSSVSIQYDKNGNPISFVEYDGFGSPIAAAERSYSWNVKDQMVKLVIGSGTSTQALGYLYGTGGDRIQQSASTSSLLYVSPAYDTTLNASGTSIGAQKHVFGGSTLFGTVQGSGTSSATFYDQTDHLSGASVITNASGTVQELIDYLPFGSIRVDEKAGSFSEQRKYAGHEFDDKSGLTYMEARYYDPVIGRFLNEDPAFRDLSFNLEDPQSMNSYAYARNNPLVMIDRDGEVFEYFMGTLAHIVISSAPNIPHAVRQADFSVTNPLAAFLIGSVTDGSSKNKSSIASNFSVNITASELGYGKQTSMGSEKNALRHVIWQGILTASLGIDIARKAGNSHEDNPFVNLTKRNFTDRALADQTADLLNNQIGRNITASNSNLSYQEISQRALDYFYKNGLYITQDDSKGGYSVVQTKISKDLYEKSSEELKKLNNTGLKH